MKKFVLSLLGIVWAFSSVFSQTKVFKEVSDDISSQVATLWQEKSVIGYVAFTRLEKAAEELYNYKITIMDENLNDIGTVNFKEEGLILQGISFEQDVICLAYFKTNMLDKRYKKIKQYNKAYKTFTNSVMLQFINLDGKIIESISTPVDVSITSVRTTTGYAPYGSLKKNIQLLNVPQQGFACFYGDEQSNLLAVYQHSGKKLWEKKIKEEPVANVNMIATGTDLYMLTTTKDNDDFNSFELISFNVKENTAHPKIKIKDKNNHWLSILTFDIDPSTQKPYLSGFLAGKKYIVSNYASAKIIARGYYAGVYSVNFNGHTQDSVKSNFTYWDNKSIDGITAKGYFRDQRSNLAFRTSFRDYAGNTYFTADGVKRTYRPGTIASSVILSPLVVVSPMILMLAGTQKAKLVDPVLLKMDPKGKLSWTKPFEGESYSYTRANFPAGILGSRTYHMAANHDLKQQYLVISEQNSSSVYDVNKKKLVRTVPLKDKNIYRAVFPAKEGHILVSEYNKKEKYTRVSIEAL